jgi:hypoxanthine phosphoribosyltransferase
VKFWGLCYDGSLKLFSVRGICSMNYRLETLVESEKVQQSIARLRSRIEEDYKASEQVSVLSLLKGSYYLTAEILKDIRLNDVRINFIKVSSYGSAMSSSGTIKIEGWSTLDIEGKDVIVLDDIFDSGLTLVKVKEFLLQYKPKSLKFCVLAEKIKQRTVDFKADYVGLTIPDEFVVGCGLDYAERHRELSYIAKVIMSDGGAS